MDEYMNFWDFGSYIVPPTLDPGPSRAPAPSSPSYETPWYADAINRAIERAAQVASLDVAGYPPYPQYPQPSPTPMPVPMPAPGVTPQPPNKDGVQLSNMTLMLLVGGALLFMAGRRR